MDRKELINMIEQYVRTEMRGKEISEQILSKDDLIYEIQQVLNFLDDIPYNLADEMSKRSISVDFDVTVVEESTGETMQGIIKNIVMKANCLFSQRSWELESYSKILNRLKRLQPNLDFDSGDARIEEMLSVKVVWR